MLLNISITNNTIKNAILRNTKTNAKKVNSLFNTSFNNTKDKRYETNANAKNTIRFFRTNPTLAGLCVLFATLETLLETCLLGALFFDTL